MLKSYITTAFRNLFRNRFFSIVNISGLAIGMAVCILIAQYIVFEKSYDEFHHNYKDVYRMVNIRYYPTHTDESAGCITALGPTLKESFPEVQEFTRCYKSSRVFSANDKPVRFERVFTVDSTFLKLFTFPITEGSNMKLLSKPNTVVLTESSAKALFGNEEAVGKTILQGEVPYLVEAIASDVPKNSHLKFDMLLSLVTDLNDSSYCVPCNNRVTYVLLKPSTNVNALEAKMDGLIKTLHAQDEMKREYVFQPLADIHLTSKLRFEHEQNGNAKSVLALSIVSVLILIIAWLNYINLTTSISISRSAEVGIRLVNGSSRKNLIVQFLVESVFVNFLALFFAMLIAQLAFPVFSSLTSIDASFALFEDVYFWMGIIITLFIGSILYGFYPAFIVSSFSPMQALKGKTILPGHVNNMRIGLVFLQFSFSIILVAGTIAMYKQISFMRHTDLGMQIDQTVVVPVPSALREGDGFKTELSQYPNLGPITHTSSIPGENAGNVGGGFVIENAPVDVAQQVYSYYVDKNYFDFLSIKLIAGRDFISDQVNNDTNTEIVLNDAGRKAFGFATPEEALGKILYQNTNVVGRIHGIVENHHNRSLDQPIAPTVYQYTKGKGYYLIKTTPSELKAHLALIKQSFNKNYTNNPFEYFFLDEYFNKQYFDHIRFNSVFGLFTLLAIFISCLGLSGLSLYNVKLRTKEIAVRKVLGATITNVLFMLSTEYTRITVLAFIVTTPIAYYFIDRWLQTFSYHISLTWWMFVMPGLLILIVAILTVTVQSLKTVLAKPAEKLRNE